MDMDDKIRSGYYDNKMEYPNRPSKPKFEKSFTSLEARHYAELLEAYEKEMDIWHGKVEAYRKENSRLLDLFRSDALESVGLKNHPKAGKAYSFAWEHGHSSGFPEVYQWLQDVAELVLE